MKPSPLLLVALLLTACGTAGPAQSHGGPVRDQVSLIDTLRKDVTVDITGTVTQPFLHPDSGTTAAVSGGPLTTPADLQLFDYSSDAAASADARAIRADGSGTATSRISWVAPPHFFLKGRVLVIYLGKDPAVIKLLTSALGSQFAGS